MAERFIALSTEDLRSMLERAWDTAAADADSLLPQLRAFASDAGAVVEENIQSSASNGHSASAHMPGANVPTATEAQRGWQKLIDLFRTSRKFLLDCSKYGLDAFTIQSNSTFPDPLPAIANPRVIVDTNARWADLIELYAIDGILNATVIGAAVGDAAVFLWMLDNLKPVRESRGDYSDAIVGRSSAAFA